MIAQRPVRSPAPACQPCSLEKKVLVSDSSNWSLFSADSLDQRVGASYEFVADRNLVSFTPRSCHTVGDVSRADNVSVQGSILSHKASFDMMKATISTPLLFSSSNL